MNENLPDPYRRVTNPERFRVLHAAARELVAELATRFVVERQEFTTPDWNGQIAPTTVSSRRMAFN